MTEVAFFLVYCCKNNRDFQTAHYLQMEYFEFWQVNISMPSVYN